MNEEHQPVLNRLLEGEISIFGNEDSFILSVGSWNLPGWVEKTCYESYYPNKLAEVILQIYDIVRINYLVLNPVRKNLQAQKLILIDMILRNSIGKQNFPNEPGPQELQNLIEHKPRKLCEFVFWFGKTKCFQGDEDLDGIGFARKKSFK